MAAGLVRAALPCPLLSGGVGWKRVNQLPEQQFEELGFVKLDTPLTAAQLDDTEAAPHISVPTF